MVGPGSLRRYSFSQGEETPLVRTQLWLAQVLVCRWGLESLWAPCHGSKPSLSLAEPGIKQEFVFFFFILSTNQSTVNSVSNF